MTSQSQVRKVFFRQVGQESLAAFVFQPELEKGAAVALDKAEDGCIAVGSCSMRCQWLLGDVVALSRIHRSLLVSISPNSSLLPPLRDVAAEVADAAELMEKAVDGLLARTYPAGRSCL